jgi:outer membrane protein assembly factor BamB
MEKAKSNNAKIAVAILALLLVTSVAMLLNFDSNTALADDYGDIMQYDWPSAGADEGNTGWNRGPGPDRPNVLWTATGRGSSMAVAFDGMLFTGSGRNVYASDPFTGDLIYTSTCDSGNASMTSGNNIHKLDDTYFVTTGSSGITVRRISDGRWVSSANTPNSGTASATMAYLGGHFSDSMKMWFGNAYDQDVHQAQVVAFDLSDPLNPTIAWIYAARAPAEVLCSGDGKVYYGTTEGKLLALDIDGNVAFETATLGGIAQQSGIYMDGKVFTSSVSWQITCFDSATGEWLWQAEKGIRAFSAYRGCAGDGMYFEMLDSLDPYGGIGAWDVETGEQLWRHPAYFNIHYQIACYADGKLYTSTCDRSSGPQTGGLVMPGYEFTCFDAYTGTVLWRLPNFSVAYPSVAYGNLYFIRSGTLYCIGGKPANWDHGFLGNLDNPRIAYLQQGPSDISTPRWEFQTDGDISSSPAVVDGKVYFGSTDKNIYCLDAYTGTLIWNYTTGHYVRASVAVVGGKVFTGADDGYFYALDANTGEKLWETSAGGFFPNYFANNEGQMRSSPVVLSSNVYCGSLDGKIYCLSTSDGKVRWTFNTDGPIMGSPLYSDSTIYITSNDGYLYALNTGGTLKWRSPFELNMSVGVPRTSEFYNIGTPAIGDGMIFIGGGCQYGSSGGLSRNEWAAMDMSYPSGANGGGIRFFAFNATTGESIWNISRAGNTQPGYVPVYYDGQIYAPEFFEVTAMSATDPGSGEYIPPDYTQSNRRNYNRTIGAWVGYQIQSSVAFAQDISGAPNRATNKIYVGSDIGSIYCLNPDTMETLSVFTVGGNVVCSATIWNGRMYVGSTRGKLYCFDDSPVVSTSISAESNKGGSMWNNETMLICGRLISFPDMQEWESNEDDDTIGTYTSVPSEFNPPLPYQTVKLTFTNPDMEDIMLETTTDKNGYFEFSYTPTAAGEWGWVAYYDANVMESLTYDASYGEWNAFTVNAPTSGGGEVQPPPTAEFPMEYVYAIVAVIIIVVVVFLAYFFLKRK